MQYYVSRSYTACQSYIDIWRHNTQSQTYNLISETLVSSADNTRGVKFQFVQNSTIEVKQGDFLGTHISSSSGCEGHSITFNSNGPQAIVYRVEGEHLTISVSDEYLRNVTRYVPLQAFIARESKLHHHKFIYPIHTIKMILVLLQ